MKSSRNWISARRPGFESRQWQQFFCTLRERGGGVLRPAEPPGRRAIRPSVKLITRLHVLPMFEKFAWSPRTIFAPVRGYTAGRQDTTFSLMRVRFFQRTRWEPVRRTTAVSDASEGMPETFKVTPNIRHALDNFLFNSAVFLKTGFTYTRLYRGGS